MEQGNVQTTEKDCTGHAETTLLRKASHIYEKDFLWDCTVYTSCEPCCMCVGAAYWANLGRIVYATTEAELLAETGNNDENPTFDSDCRSILERGQKDIVVKGPVKELQKEAFAIHVGFWN